MSNTKILIVDDDPLVRDMLSAVLQSNGYAVETAGNGIDALKKYHADKGISLIVSDMDMPQMNGIALIRELRKNKQDVPVIFLTGNQEISTAVEAMHSGANDYILKDEVIEDTIILSVKDLLEKKEMKEKNQQLMERMVVLSRELSIKNVELSRFNEILKNTIDKLTQIGTALSSEKNPNRLLEKILTEALETTNADCGILYILEAGSLNPMAHINKSKNIFTGKASEKPIGIPSLSINDLHISIYCARNKKLINIPDAYDAYGTKQFKLSGVENYDNAFGYKSRSIVVLPMLDLDDNVIGVLNLINSIEHGTGNIIEFSGSQVEIANSLASQAAVAITSARLYKEAYTLFESIVEMMAVAIDEKSPATRGHVSRVASITMAIAEEINRSDDGYFKDMQFSEEELNELRIAALLHDVGKITTPEFVIEKKTKLETVFDKIALIEARINSIRNGLAAESLKKKCLAIEKGEPPETIKAIEQSLEKQLMEMDADLKFLKEANKPEEFMDDRMFEHLKKIAPKKFILDGREFPIINDDEFKMLSIRKGSITHEELEIMRNHASVTIKMLGKIPFTRRLKNVSIYAGGHHERLDGSGYPLCLKAPQIPLQTRIIALADLFEALVAADRPYKKPISIEDALKIMEREVKDNRIDGALFSFFVDKRIYEKLPPRTTF